MDRIEDEIRRGLKGLGKTQSQVLLLTVKSVDEANATCDGEVDGLVYSDIRLRSIIDGSEDGLVCIPAIDSIIIAERFGNSNQLAVILFSKIDKIKFKIGDTTCTISADGIVFNGGELGGLVKLEALVTKINAIEDSVNSLKQVFSTWVPVAQDGGAALKFAVTSWATQTITKTTSYDLKNDKIKQ